MVHSSAQTLSIYSTPTIAAWACLSVALPARATAGTGNPALTTGDAPDSICPSGWRLPGGSGEKSYSVLLQNYLGIEKNTDNLINHHTPLLFPVLSFVRSGYYNHDYASFIGMATNGLFWSSASGETDASYLDFGSTYIHPDKINYRGRGQPLRCLAR